MPLRLTQTPVRSSTTRRAPLTLVLLKLTEVQEHFKKKIDCTQSNLFDKLFKTHSGQKLLTSWSSERIRLYTRLFLRWESKSD